MGRRGICAEKSAFSKPLQPLQLDHGQIGINRGIWSERAISAMKPVTTVTAAWTIAKTAGEISKKLYEFGKGLKGRELKQQIDEILDQVRELKQSASELEDENRSLRDKLRFKSDEYEFSNPFRFAQNLSEMSEGSRILELQLGDQLEEPNQCCAFLRS